MNHPHPELPYPPKLQPKTLRIVALGGLGEIGRNMTVYEYEGQLLIVDCGVLFPEESQPGIDLILPDFSYIRERLNDVVAVVLTHGHEDHIGAVPYLLRERTDIPVVGAKLTLAFTEAKLKERRITAPLVEVREGMTQKFGPFELEFVAVNHSIPDALAVAIKTPAGVVLATGSIKQPIGHLLFSPGIRHLLYAYGNLHTPMLLTSNRVWRAQNPEAKVHSSFNYTTPINGDLRT